MTSLSTDRPAPAGDVGPVHILVFLVGPFALGMPLENVRRILAPPEDRQFGAAVFYGRDALPVIPVAAQLGIPDPAHPRRVIVVGWGDRQVAFGVDTVTGTIAVDNESREMVPPEVSLLPHGTMPWCVPDGGRTIFVLDAAEFAEACA